MAEESSNITNKNSLNLRLDLRLIVVILLAIIAVMLFLWKPWSVGSSDDRTVKVTGETTVKAEPDEFIFYPTYQTENDDKAAALKELTATSETVIAKLKELGVADKDIKTDTSGYDFPVYPVAEGGQETTYSLRLTVRIDNRDKAQTVQDYLVGTAPTGSVSPQATFSDTKRHQLESQARDEATKDARAKAEQSATNLGFKLGKVKAVEDGLGFGDDIITLEARGAAEVASDSSKLSVQPGQDEFRYSVTVTYFLR